MKKAEAMEEESLAYKLAVYFIDSREKGREPVSEPWRELQRYQEQNDGVQCCSTENELHQGNRLQNQS